MSARGALTWETARCEIRIGSTRIPCSSFTVHPTPRASAASCPGCGSTSILPGTVDGAPGCTNCGRLVGPVADLGRDATYDRQRVTEIDEHGRRRVT